MKKQPFMLNIFLAAVVGVACLALLLCRTLAPLAIPLRFDIPMMLGLSLIALILEAYCGPCQKRPWVWTVLLGAITFALLPWCAGIANGVPIWKLGLIGGAIFALTTLLYTFIMERVSTGPTARLAPISNALVLFLAGQALSGLL